MSKLRLLFVKEAQASYISHLDLLRTFQRCFPRTELEIKHSNGFHPHPLISIVLPLPVGQSSECELLDYEVTQETDGKGIAEKLTTGMPTGIRILESYPAERPIKELMYLKVNMDMEYDNGVPDGAVEKLKDLFAQQEIIIQKKTKRKQLADVDIAPLIKSVVFEEYDHLIHADLLVFAQNPGLNPQLLEKAIEKYCPSLIPDYSRIRRMAILDENMQNFR